MSDTFWKNPQGMDLFQAISLLERRAPLAEKLGGGSGRGEAVRLSGFVTLGFSPGDVVSVERSSPGSDPPRWRLVTPVLALAGATGPLPLTDTEQLLKYRGRRGRPPLDFLDIFHHRWLSFLYRSRKQHRLGLQWEGPRDAPLARALDAMTGLGLANQAHGPGDEQIWLRHAALLGPAPRSMAQLESLLKDRFGVPVSGHQCVGGWAPLAERQTPRLGRGAALGERVVLGCRAWDSSAGIRLELGPVPAAGWDGWLPGGANLALLAWLLRRHAQSDLRLHITLKPSPRDMHPLPRLGAARLGWSSWLTPGKHPGAMAPVQLRLPITGT